MDPGGACQSDQESAQEHMTAQQKCVWNIGAERRYGKGAYSMGKGKIPTVALKILAFTAMCVCAGALLIGTHQMRDTNDARSVHEIPDGFVEMEKLEDAGLDPVFWESQISITQGERCVYQTSVRDESFIVKYQGKYYLNLAVLQDIIEDEGAKDTGSVLLS